MKKVKRVSAKVAKYVPDDFDANIVNTIIGEVKIRLEEEFARIFDETIEVEFDDVAYEGTRMHFLVYIYFDEDDYKYPDNYSFYFEAGSWYRDEDDFYEDLQEREERFVDSVTEEY